MIDRLVLLGATGDLSGRFLLPALARAVAAGDLPRSLRVVGAGHQDWDDAAFAAHVRDRLAEHAGDVPAALRGELVAGLRYRRLEPTDAGSVAAAVRALDDGQDAGSSPVAVYLALPPDLFPPVLDALGALELPPGSRVAVEKPFGHDLASARALDAQLARAVGEASAGFRVDHALAMPRVAEMVALRSPGGELEGVWNGAALAQVDLLWEESFGLRGRAAFYDRTGTVRDVVQNHVLQVLVLLAMELPAEDDEQALHAAKLDLLRAVRVLTPDEVATRTRRARYTAGELPGADGGAPQAVPGYAEEPGVDPARGTETYAEVVLEVDTPRWAGTRFVLRAGKGLAATRKGVALHPREGGDPRWVELDDPGTGSGVSGELAAYQVVLHDVLAGGSRVSVSSAEAEQSWRIVDPVLAAWAAGDVPLLEHPAGTPGPGLLDGVRGPDGESARA